MDCYGDYLCIGGVCRAPEQSPSSPPAAPAPEPPASSPAPQPTPQPAPAPTPQPTVQPQPAPTPPPQTSYTTPQPATGKTAAQPAARGGVCVRDFDCKGDRVCNGGYCESPRCAPVPCTPVPCTGATAPTPAPTAPPPSTPPATATAQPQPPAPTPTPAPEPVEPAPPATAGWALAGSITGFSSVLVISVLGGAATGNYSTNRTACLALGASATVLVAAVSPLAYASGKSARKGGARGILALRPVGWIFYGLSLVSAVAQLSFAANDLKPLPWFVSTAMITGNLSVLFFSIDALISHLQAKKLMTKAEAPKPTEPPAVSLLPVVAPVAAGGNREVSGGYVGISGWF